MPKRSGIVESQRKQKVEHDMESLGACKGGNKGDCPNACRGLIEVFRVCMPTSEVGGFRVPCAMCSNGACARHQMPAAVCMNGTDSCLSLSMQLQPERFLRFPVSRLAQPLPVS